MTVPEKAALLRIYTEERSRDGHRPLYEAIVLKARHDGLAGATVVSPVPARSVSQPEKQTASNKAKKAKSFENIFRFIFSLRNSYALVVSRATSFCLRLDFGCESSLRFE